jgi:hypothetical protein
LLKLIRMASKKTNEEIEKQIKIKEEFADKIYKKMRADRYGLTFCCPNDLQNINIKNYICDWQDIGYETMPEEYNKNYTRSPIPNYCAPPGVYNVVTGLCDAQASQELVGTTSFSFANSIPNGTPTSIVPANSSRYGRDCPIIFDSVNLNGTGSNPTMIIASIGSSSQWWRYYDATDPSGEFFNPLNPNVSSVSFANALGKRPSGGWPPSQTYEWAVNVTPTATTTYHVGICADHKFGISTTTSGVTTDLIAINNFNPTDIVQSIGQADSDWNPDGLGTYSWQGLIDQQGHRAGLCHSASLWDYNQSVDPFTGLGDNNRVGAARWFIYPITLDAGCHRINIKGFNKDFEGMLAAFVVQNSKAELIAAQSRSDLNEIFASDLQTALYQNIDSSNPWTCEGPGLLFTASPYSADCPGCRIQSSTTILQCPDGYAYNEERETCEATFLSCDTETLNFEVINQNGEVIPSYEIVFDGGNYTTNDEGKLEIIVENASVNTDHILNLCHCITTGGGCAIQNIKITVTDPNAVVCTPVEETCPCKAPALLNTVMPTLLDNPQYLKLTFQDLNLSNLSNTIESYIFEYRVYTAAGDGGWQTITVTKPASGTTFLVELGVASLTTYEYRIKTKCTKSESGYSGIYSVEVPYIDRPENLIAWWDFTDKDNMFTDLAGTTKVANAGDFIRRINNKATDTNKLGIFLRSVETTGWTNVFTSPPSYQTDGVNSNSYGRFVSEDEFTIYGLTTPLVGSSAAGFGGTTDGVKFSELTALSNQAITTFIVMDSRETALGGSTESLLVLNGTKNSDASYSFVECKLEGSDMSGLFNIFTSDPTTEEAQLAVNPETSGQRIFISRSNANSAITPPVSFFGENGSPTEDGGFLDIMTAAPLETLDISVGNYLGSNRAGAVLGAQHVAGTTSTTDGFRGRIYEVLIYNQALTDNEVTAVLEFLKNKYTIVV